MWFQQHLVLDARPRGIYCITDEIRRAAPDLQHCRVGLLHLFLQHTSASLAINENASPAVRADLATHLDKLVPDGASHFTHTLEGPDDMPAHVKTVLTGSSLLLPITDGELSLGTWQGVYLCEHRNHAGPRHLLITGHGEASQTS